MRLDVFRAIERRFKGDALLVRKARRIYRGFAGDKVKSVRPYIVVNEEASENMSGFDVDVELLPVEMAIESKGRDGLQCDEIMSQVLRVFKDATMEDGSLLITDMQFTGRTGPTLDDGVYRATMTFNTFIQYKVLVPSARSS